MYTSNKPHIRKKVKDCITGKKAAFRNCDQVELKAVRKELNQHLTEARGQQKDRLEQNFTSTTSPKKCGTQWKP